MRDGRLVPSVDLVARKEVDWITGDLPPPVVVGRLDDANTPTEALPLAHDVAPHKSVGRLADRVAELERLRRRRLQADHEAIGHLQGRLRLLLFLAQHLGGIAFVEQRLVIRILLHSLLPQLPQRRPLAHAHGPTGRPRVEHLARLDEVSAAPLLVTGRVRHVLVEPLRRRLVGEGADEDDRNLLREDLIAFECGASDFAPEGERVVRLHLQQLEVIAVLREDALTVQVAVEALRGERLLLHICLLYTSPSPRDAHES
eukprot:1002953-Prymnesium_polylepis.1